MTQIQLSKELECSQSYVSQIERATAPLMPARDMLAKIYALTGGAVSPNDFVDLPDLQKDAA